MTPLERLRKDHAVLRAKLALLDNALVVGPEAAFAIREMVYMIGRRLAEHEQRENVELYPVVEETLADPQDQFAKSLAMQHEELELLLRALHRLTLRGLRMPFTKVMAVGRQFIDTLRDHMDREERLLFPVVERLAVEREAAARAKTATKGEPPMQETMTVNRIIGLYPDTKRVFHCHCIDCAREGADFLDEVAWRHAVPVRDLLRELHKAARCPCGPVPEEEETDEGRLEPEEHAEPFAVG